MSSLKSRHLNTIRVLTVDRGFLQISCPSNLDADIIYGTNAAIVFVFVSPFN